MGQNKHTQGPWHIAKRTNGLAIEHREERSYGYCQHEIALIYPLAMPDKKTGEANARLICAAPDMLAALETIANSEQYDGDSFVCDFDTLQSVARAAIARAKGE